MRCWRESCPRRAGEGRTGPIGAGARDFAAGAPTLSGNTRTGPLPALAVSPATGLATVIGPYGPCFPLGCSLEGVEAIAFGCDGTLRAQRARSRVRGRTAANWA